MGSLGAMGVAFPGPQLKGSLKVLVKAFDFTPRDPKALLTTLQEMSNRARREGTYLWNNLYPQWMMSFLLVVFSWL